RPPLHLRGVDNADVLPAPGRDPGLLGYVLRRLFGMAGDVDRREVRLAILAAVYQRLDVIQGPFLADDGLAAQMALAARPVEDTGSDTRRGALFVGVALPFFHGASHHALSLCLAA